MKGDGVLLGTGGSPLPFLRVLLGLKATGAAFSVAGCFCGCGGGGGGFSSAVGFFAAPPFFAAAAAGAAATAGAAAAGAGVGAATAAGCFVVVVSSSPLPKRRCRGPVLGRGKIGWAAAGEAESIAAETATSRRSAAALRRRREEEEEEKEEGAELRAILYSCEVFFLFYLFCKRMAVLEGRGKRV